MRKLLTILCFLLSAFCLHAQTATTLDGRIVYLYPHPVYHVQNPHYITAFSQATNVDTNVVKAGTVLGGQYMKIHGTSLKHIVIINEGADIQMTGGIEADDSYFVDIYGFGTSPYSFGFQFLNGNSSGNPVHIIGKSHDIKLYGYKLIGGVNGGIWAKTELSEVQSRYACDLSYKDTPMLRIDCSYNWVENVGGEAFYFGSTNPNGGDRPLTCGGVTTYPVPQKIGYMKCNYNIIINAGRTGAQMSGSITNPDNYGEFIGNKIYYPGRGLESSQGTGLSVGGLYLNPILRKDSVFGSYNSNYFVQGYGNVIMDSLYGDSSGYWKTTKNPAQIPPLWTRNSKAPTSWKLTNSTLYHGTAVTNGHPTQYALYADNLNADTGNIICNNIGTVDVFGKFNYTNACVVNNIPPVVSAGSDVAITLPATTVNLSGTATDADGSISLTTWGNSDGCSITSAGSLTTTATCTTSGDHIFVLSATDNSGATTTDNMTATVNAAANTPPVAIPQPDTIVYEPIDTLLIHQNATDADGTIIGYNTFIISSHFPVSINNPTSQTPTIVGLTAGDTILVKLKVLDNNGASGSGTTTIIVLPNPVNHKPHARINRDTLTAIRQPIGVVNVDASNSTDPDAGDYIAAYEWKFIRGNSSVIMTGVNASVLTLDNLGLDTTFFRLIVTDSHGAKDSLDFGIIGEMTLRFKIIRSSGRTTFNPIYGALWAGYTVPQKVQASHIFGFKENRVEVNFLTWNGTNSPVADQLVDSGQLVSLNIRENLYSDTTHYSNVDLTAYARHVDTLTNHLDPAVVTLVQGNEGNSSLYHSISDTTDLDPNIQMLSIVTRIGHAKGFKVADGGITSGDLVFTTYRYLSDTHDPDKSQQSCC
jgi:hypothetical protein